MLGFIVMASLVILGLYAAMGEEMVLESLREDFEYITSGYLMPIRPALYECPICMASIWGTVIWFATGGGEPVYYLLFIFGIAGFNYLAVQMMDE